MRFLTSPLPAAAAQRLRARGCEPLLISLHKPRGTARLGIHLQP